MRLSAPHHRSISSPASIPQLKTQVCLLPMASFSKEDEQGSSVKNVAVIGAGVSGLSAAYKLKLHGLNVTVFEADGRVGGKLRSISRDGLIWDEGANTMTESEAPVGFMLDNLGLRDKQQFPLSQHKRYIAKNGVPVLLPSDPVALIRSSFLSTGSKLQIFLEPFLWKNNNASKGPDVKESVGAFFQRHFGKEVVDYLIDPFVAGTSGGDPESLSMQHVFPEIWNLEKSFGSIISGAIQSKFAAKKDTFGGMDSSAKKKQKHGSFSFLGGMQTLTDALCNELGKDELKLQSKVLEITCSCSEKSPQDNWSLSYALNDKRLSSEKSFDALIVTAPLSDVKQMKITKHGSPFPLDFIPEFIATEEKIATEELKLVPVKRDCKTDWTLPPIYNISESLELIISKVSSGVIRTNLLYLLPSMEIIVFIPICYEQVSYLPMSVIITTFKRENVKRPLEGFGVLVPSKEQLNGLRTLGTLFSSMMFPDRAPSDVYLYTTFVGGSRNRELAKASSEELKEMVTSDLRQLLGAEGEPAYLNHYYWSKAFPLYGLNYGSVIQAIDKMEKDLPGLFYAGNHKGGLSVGKAISTGCQAADLVISYLNSTSDANEKS